MNIEKIIELLLLVDDKADEMSRSDNVIERDAYYSIIHSCLDLVYEELEKNKKFKK